MHALGRNGWRLQTTTRPKLQPTSSMSLMDDLNASLCVHGRQRISTTTSEQQITLLILGHSQPPHNVVATLIISNKHMYCTLPWKLTTEPKVHHQLPCLNAPDQSSKNAQLSHQNRLNVKPTDQNIWLANSHRPKWTTTINIDSRYKSNVTTKHLPTTPKLQAPTNKIE